MAGWVLLGGGLLVCALAVRIGARGARGLTQGCGMLIAAIGVLLLLRRPGSSIQLPGHGPRRWHQP